MRFRSIILVCTLVLLNAARLHAADLNIAAAISLKNALEQAKPDLERAAGGKITFNYGASGTLAAQIRQGMPIDLFVSADQSTMKGLVDAKLVDEKSTAVLVGNELVLIVPKTPREGVTIHGFSDLLGPAVQHVAIGEPKVVPAGAYAVAALKYLKVYDGLATGNKLVQGENVAQVLAYVQRGEADAGLVFRTDALASKATQIIATTPVESHPPIVYMIGIPRGSKNQDIAESMKNVMLAEKVQGIFAGFGFVPTTKVGP
jgi:molybdate transport system substrate-binding protein